MVFFIFSSITISHMLNGAMTLNRMTHNIIALSTSTKIMKLVVSALCYCVLLSVVRLSILELTGILIKVVLLSVVILSALWPSVVAPNMERPPKWTSIVVNVCRCRPFSQCCQSRLCFHFKWCCIGSQIGSNSVSKLIGFNNFKPGKEEVAQW